MTKISTGVYNTRDYSERVYVSRNAALKYAVRHGYKFSELMPFEWSFQGKQYKISIS